MSEFNQNKIGRYLPQEGGHKAFMLFTFPPENGFLISSKLHKKHEEAIYLIGELDGITRLFSDKDFFAKMFIKKEAVASSQIEGSQVTLGDAVLAPVVEIENYIAAASHVLGKTSYLPVSLTLIKEIYAKLMVKTANGNGTVVGEFRKIQNWVGGKTLEEASFIPPAPDDMSYVLNELEKFIYATDDCPDLIKAGLLHAQFETIHPFEGGNGRIGRILITLYIHHKKLLGLPVLYLSSYFRKYQQAYYQKLNDYHEEEIGIDEWLDFFLDGVIETAKSAIDTCAKVTSLYHQDTAKVQTLKIDSTNTSLDLIGKLCGQPIIGALQIEEWTGYALEKSQELIEKLVKLEILKPMENTKYGQKYVYANYYALFDDGNNQTETKKEQ